MEPIEVYKTSDGRYFEDERVAMRHQLGIVKESLEELLPNDDHGRITNSDRYNIISKQLSDPDLEKKVTKLYRAITYR